MKKLILTLCLFAFENVDSQVVFCPPGTHWNYLFSGSMWSPGTFYNEKIIYLGDSISGAETIKIVEHSRFFLMCSPSVKRTYFKQKGDTIYMLNKFTQNTWQILYNYAAIPGQSWQTILQAGSSTYTFTHTVDSVNYILVNGYNLRRLKVSTPSSGKFYITERFGSSGFLFNFWTGNTACDGNGFSDFLCYQDSAFGLKQFTIKPCDFVNYTGINSLGDLNVIKIYPNPVADILNLELTLESVPGELIISDIFGKVITRKSAIEKRTNVADLAPGLYELRVSQGDVILYQGKLIKE